MHNLQSVAKPAVKMTKLLALIVHLASALGDWHTFAIASTYIFTVTLAKSVRMTSATEYGLGLKVHVRALLRGHT